MRCMQHAIAYTAPSQQQVYGAKATINVWDPVIQESNGFSLSQLWILSGSFNGSDLNSIEAGWQVRSTILSIYIASLRRLYFLLSYIFIYTQSHTRSMLTLNSQIVSTS